MVPRPENSCCIHARLPSHRGAGLCPGQPGPLSHGLGTPKAEILSALQRNKSRGAGVDAFFWACTAPSTAGRGWLPCSRHTYVPASALGTPTCQPALSTTSQIQNSHSLPLPWPGLFWCQGPSVLFLGLTRACLPHSQTRSLRPPLCLGLPSCAIGPALSPCIESWVLQAPLRHSLGQQFGQHRVRPTQTPRG